MMRRVAPAAAFVLTLFPTFAHAGSVTPAALAQQTVMTVRASVEAPITVPEPGTISLLIPGVVYAVARLRQRRSK